MMAQLLKTFTLHFVIYSELSLSFCLYFNSSINVKPHVDEKDALATLAARNSKSCPSLLEKVLRSGRSDGK
jgi:hypothetical protein